MPPSPSSYLYQIYFVKCILKNVLNKKKKTREDRKIETNVLINKNGRERHSLVGKETADPKFKKKMDELEYSSNHPTVIHPYLTASHL